MLQDTLSHDNPDTLNDPYAADESTTKLVPITFEEQYHNVLQEDNLDDIFTHLMGHQTNQQTYE